MILELAQDFRDALAEMPEDQRTHRALELLEGAIHLSSHVLVRDPLQLPSQLTGRLLTIEQPALQKLLAQFDQFEDRQWLRPLIPSVTPPGGPLLRILEGHTDNVNSVVLTPDGKQAVSGSSDKTLKVWNLERDHCTATFECDAQIHECAVEADHGTIVAGDKGGRVHFLKLMTGTIAKSSI